VAVYRVMLVALRALVVALSEGGDVTLVGHCYVIAPMIHSASSGLQGWMSVLFCLSLSSLLSPFVGQPGHPLY
jgi:hypothetical protein